MADTGVGPSTSPRLPDNIAVLGLGIIGSLTALGILQRAPTTHVTVYEVRPAPSTIGGALNISPNAHRCMAKLGVPPTRYGATTPWVLFQNDLGKRVGEFKYGGKGDRWADGYEGMRAERSDIQVCVIGSSSCVKSMLLELELSLLISIFYRHFSHVL